MFLLWAIAVEPYEFSMEINTFLTTSNNVLASVHQINFKKINFTLGISWFKIPWSNEMSWYLQLERPNFYIYHVMILTTLRVTWTLLLMHIKGLCTVWKCYKINNNNFTNIITHIYIYILNSTNAWIYYCLVFSILYILHLGNTDVHADPFRRLSTSTDQWAHGSCR